MAFTDIYSEDSPNTSTQANTLGVEIASKTKRAFRERLAVDHYFLATEGSDVNIGYHKKITLMEQAADPTYVANTMVLYTKQETVKNNSAIYMMTEGGVVKQLTEEGDFIGGMSGEIKIWSGAIANIRTGWLLCNGDNSTPDLRDKFVVGAGSTYAVGATGGAVEHTHTNSAHTHDHEHGTINSAGPSGDNRGWNGAESAAHGPAHIHVVTIGNKTSGNASANTMDTISNLPPYHALAYIMKV